MRKDMHIYKLDRIARISRNPCFLCICSDRSYRGFRRQPVGTREIQFNFTSYRMFVALVFAFVVAQVAAEIPSYIHVCGRRDPNIEQCILDNVLNLKDKICEGMPELDIPSNEPIILEDLVISNTSNTKIYLQKAYVKGVCNYEINSLHVDLEKNRFDVDLTFKRIEINATYDVDVRILVPIVAKGPIVITTENVQSKVQFNLKTVMKGGKKYAYVSQMKLDLDIKGYDAQLLSLNNETLKQFREAIRNFVGNNQRDVINVIKPSIEKLIPERILLVANQIVKHFTYDELFPDRT